MQGTFPKWATYALVLYLLVQVALPLRHWFIPGNVNWTEEGHKYSWRMMLRSKSGSGRYLVKDQKSGKQEWVYPREYLTNKQYRKVAAFPDMTWQFAQRLKAMYEEKGWEEVAVYAHFKVSLNGNPKHDLVDTEVDLTKVKWNFFGHANWKITPEYDN